MQVISPSRVDFIVNKSRLYWTDTQLNEVKTSALLQGPIDTILDTEIVNPVVINIDLLINFI